MTSSGFQQFWFVICLCVKTSSQLTQTRYNSSDPLIIQVGLVYEPATDPVTGLATLSLAESALRDDVIIPNWVQFNYIQRVGCEIPSGVAGAIDLAKNQSVDVIIGPACDSSMLSVATLGSYWNIPIVGYGSTSGDLANKNQYNTFIRSIYNTQNMAAGLIDVLLYFNWLTVGVITNDDGSCDSFRNSWVTQLNYMLADVDISNITQGILISLDFSNLNSTASSWKYAAMRARARIFIVCVGSDIHDARPFLLQMQSMNMTTSDYVYIIPYLQKNDLDTTPLWQAKKPDGQDAAALVACKQVLTVDQQLANESAIASFKSSLISFMKQPPWNHSVQSLNASQFLTYLHDAMYLYGIGLSNSLSQSLDSYRNGDKFQDLTANVAFVGASGLLQTGKQAVRLSQFMVQSWDGSSLSNLFTMAFADRDQYGWQTGIVSLIRPEIWYTDNLKAPPDTPYCGFDGSYCTDSTRAVIAAPIVVVLVFIIIAGLVAFIRYRQMSAQREFLKLSWKVERHELHKISKVKAGKIEDASVSTTSDSMASGSQLSSDLSTISSGKLAALDSKVENGVLLFNKAPFVGVGDFRDQRVAVKQIRQFSFSGSFSTKELLLIHSIKEMRHENINMFLGIVMSPPPALILWTYCQRGSLDDILYNDHIELDMMFKCSLMRDLVKGLEYLHRSVIAFHGSLTTTNCVVDARWVLKLTDFGLHNILKKLQQSGKSLNEVDDQFYSQSMYHMAPELLVQAFEKRATIPSKESDIYALGMVLFQILFREQPFINMNISPAEIIRKIAYPGLGQIIRPQLPKRSGLNHGFSVLFNLCWDEAAQSRPPVSSIKESIYALTKQYNANIIDHVIKLMEEYTENLEKTVEERTKELDAEREKADMLLREMLPVTVADDLKAGKTVLPESYESVTIYFSNIMQFAEICRTSSPLEVVTLLNQLYSNFDSMTKLYDVYKVETIGDAYMVASGLPIRNGMRHVTEICNMALHLRKFVLSEFIIPHRQLEKLQIKIGIHSGPAASGVIGLAMPRYCVFGDTVNVASRMESTSEAMKIQVSQQTAQALEKRREYLVEKRGVVEIKGKGLCETFWLIDRIPIAEAVLT